MFKTKPGLFNFDLLSQILVICVLHFQQGRYPDIHNFICQIILLSIISKVHILLCKIRYYIVYFLLLTADQNIIWLRSAVIAESCTHYKYGFNFHQSKSWLILHWYLDRAYVGCIHENLDKYS